MDWLDVKVTLNLNNQEIKRIDRIRNNKPYKYESRSHFIRCATMKLLQKEEKNGLPVRKMRNMRGSDHIW